MKFVAFVLVAFACSGAFASEPGQPLDCSDWTIVQPGITCSAAIPPDCSSQSACIRGVPVVSDNTGRLLYIRRDPNPIGSCGTSSLYRTMLLARDINVPAETLIAVVYDRCTGSVLGDEVDAIAPNESTEPPQTPTIHEPVVFDPMGGRLLAPLLSYCRTGYGGPGCPAYIPDGRRVWLASFSGFATLFEMLQTYTPQPAALGFRVPYMPDGLHAADHFDTYWGHLSTVGDWSQAHPLQCNYPATSPHVGDYLSVADTVPTPVPGRGIYYVTAATYQGATRYGRKTTAGHLTGRDPALLPACTP